MTDAWTGHLVEWWTWWTALTPDQWVLFTLPFWVAGLAFLADGLRRRSDPG